MIKVKWNNTWITDYVISVNWSGSEAQCSRTLEISIANNPYDANFKQLVLKLGDVLYFYEDKKRLFVGTIVSRERVNSKGTITIQARDAMNHLLKSKTSRNFRNSSPELITQSICKEIGIKVGSLAKTGIHIAKYYPKEENAYNIIIGAYRKAMKHTKKKYMPCMDGTKFCVIEKGKESGVILTSGTNLLSASYSDNLDSMINKVKVYNEKGKQVAVYEKESWVKKYGIYQETYEKEDGVNIKTGANALMKGIEKSASVEALGDTKAISGKSIKIQDKGTGLTGVFWIQSDQHTWENGQHKMSLELAFKNVMESVSVNQMDETKKQTNSGSSTSHSSSGSSGRAGISKNPKINKITALAKSFQGKVRYVWGATTPQNGKSDCSGFTQYVYKKAANISIGRTTNDQVKKGTKVYKSQLKIGDLVMFKDTYDSGYTYGVSHVGIYIGQNNFIHCSKSKGVTINGLNESFWKEHWLMGRRIIK